MRIRIRPKYQCGSNPGCQSNADPCGSRSRLLCNIDQVILGMNISICFHLLKYRGRLYASILKEHKKYVKKKIFKTLNPDPHFEYGSGSRSQILYGSMRIRIQNTCWDIKNMLNVSLPGIWVPITPGGEEAAVPGSHRAQFLLKNNTQKNTPVGMTFSSFHVFISSVRKFYEVHISHPFV